MYVSEAGSEKPDPYAQYGAYRSYGRVIALVIAGLILATLSVGTAVWYLGWLAAGYLFGPILTATIWIGWKYFRSTATLPPEIASGLVFLSTYEVHWAPSDLNPVVNGWGIFGGEHTTAIDAGLTHDALYLHFDDRLYIVPFLKIQSATPTEIYRLGTPKMEDALKFEFNGILPFSIALTWPADHIGSTIAKITAQQSEETIDAA